MALTRLEIKSRQTIADGQAFGNTGAYEQLDGTAHFAVDPAHPLNAVINDITLAPRDAQGRVQFSADFRILVPADRGRGNRKLFWDVVNRGNRGALGRFNLATGNTASGPTDAGDGFLMRLGYTVVWCGWQHDVPQVGGLMAAQFPEALGPDGKPVQGKIMVEFQPNVVSQVGLLADRQHKPYGAVDLNERDAVIIVRDAPELPATTIPRDQWSFQDESHVFMEAGFQPGKHYAIVYMTGTAPIIGLGFLTPRDLVSFLRHGSAADGNPCAGMIDYAYTFGASQSGRFLREVLYLGENEDEEGRIVFDGVMAHIGGGTRGWAMNQRYGQPSSTINKSITSQFPHSVVEQTDPETGRTDSILARLRARNLMPKLFITNSSTEYWRGDASLNHVSTDGSRDLEELPNVRIYHFAGTQHGPGSLPLNDSNIQGGRAAQPMNITDYTPLLRANLMNLDLWVTQGIDPPPSLHPRLDDGTAVARESLAGAFNVIPGAGFPGHVWHPYRLNLGPDMLKGIATVLPPERLKPYPSFVAAVDADANEVRGIRLPDISVPLATYTGWNLRHASTGGADQIMELTGATIPFAATREERMASGDPRLSIEERYASKQDYLDKVAKAADELIGQGYVLAQDKDLIMEEASARYDALRYRTDRPAESTAVSGAAAPR